MAKHWWNKELWPGNPGGPMGIGIKRPKRIPPVFWKRVHRTRVTCGVVYLLAWATYFVLGITASGIGLAGCPAIALVLLLPIIWAIAPRVALRRWRRHLEAEGWHCCLECGYSLHGLPSPHTCPECGTAYDLSELETAWQEWARKGLLPEKE